MVYPPQLGEGLVDEDEGDKYGENFLGEARDEAHHDAAIEGHNHQHDDHEPHSDPHSPYYILDVLGLAELRRN